MGFCAQWGLATKATPRIVFAWESMATEHHYVASFKLIICFCFGVMDALHLMLFTRLFVLYFSMGADQWKLIIRFSDEP